MEPSFRFSISLARSSPIEASTIARRDTTTLLRLRSSLITLKSSVLPSMWDVSLIGRVSTKEPGKNARMPLVITVRPPLTLPVTVPITVSPLSSACSRLTHAARRLARSRDRRVSPRPSSKASIATETKSPSLTSSTPWSFRNSSKGIKLSDFNPAFTTTWFWSMRRTSAVMTSPARISWREMDSANIAAKELGAAFLAISLRLLSCWDIKGKFPTKSHKHTITGDGGVKQKSAES